MRDETQVAPRFAVVSGGVAIGYFEDAQFEDGGEAEPLPVADIIAGGGPGGGPKHAPALPPRPRPPVVVLKRGKTAGAPLPRSLFGEGQDVLLVALDRAGQAGATFEIQGGQEISWPGPAAAMGETITIVYEGIHRKA